MQLESYFYTFSLIFEAKFIVHIGPGFHLEE